MIQFLISIALATSIYGQSEVLPMSFSNLPACAGPSATPRPKPEADGSFLLLHIKDPSGIGAEIWCAKEAAGFNYQYRLSAPDGRSRRLDRCQLPDGINSVGVEHEGPVAETPLPNGGQFLRTAGRLVRLIHNNWDTHAGHHAIYDFRRQHLTIYATTAVEDAAGRRVRTLNDVHGFALDAIPQSEPLAALGNAPPERAFDPNRVTCVTALSDEGMRIHEEEVHAFIGPNQAGKLTVAWPESSPIDKIEFDAARRHLKLKFPPTARKTIVSIAFPRTMLGLGNELSHVRLDGRFVESEESTTTTHKSIRFRLDEPAREALLTESGGFPFFMVTAIALAGAILIGGVFGMLFRRKLPPVADDIDSRDLPQ